MHTKGPIYKVEAGRCITRNGVPFVTIHPCKNEKTGSANFPFTEADDFARLIAAAPDLLEVARELSLWLRTRTGPADGTIEMLSRAVEAIAKVEGREG